MSFTEKERAYLAAQLVGRLATVDGRGQPHVVPVGYHFDAARGEIEITGRGLAASRKFRDIAREPKVAFVVDDVPSTDPWVARGIEIRGVAEALTSGGRALNPNADDELIRIAPARVIAWGIDAGWQDGPNARDFQPGDARARSIA
jgi:PPOX class F420-dependent enzyme/OxyR family protein